MATSTLFDRRCIVNVDGVQSADLRTQFKVTKTLVKEPNTLDLRVSNLSESSRSAIRSKGARVILLAGYPGSEAVIFSGDARSVDHRKVGPDWETHVQCGDGERAYQFARFSQSFKPGTPIADVIAAAAKALGVDATAAIARVNQGGFRGGLTQFVHGFAAHGKASAELDRLLATVGLTWSIQDGALQVLGPKEALTDQAILLSPSTGLVGSVDHGTPQALGLPAILKFKALLMPQVRPGSVVQIDSAGIKGQFRVQKATHTGDTMGNDWYTEGEVLPK